MDGSFFFAHNPSDSTERRSEKFAIFLVAGACSVAGICWGLMYYLIYGLSLTAVLPLSFTILVGGALFSSHFTRNHYYAVYAQVFCIMYVTAAIQWSIGGILDSGFVMVWALLGPVVALMLLSRTQAIIWFILYVVNIVVTVVFDDFFATNVRPVSRTVVHLYFAMNMGIFSSIIFAFAIYFVRAAVVEREKANRLLLNILPHSIAQELKDHGATAPRSYASASVLFTDFQGFTARAQTMDPEKLVAELDDIFQMFDAVVQSHGLEKIKTIGDAYMCAGGLPEVSRTHAIDCALAGLAMISCVARTKAKSQGEGEPYWDMRIGIHTGPLVASVVGTRKFAYDLWGDTVNTAGRMESGGSPGRLNVSAATYAEVRFLFECEHRGRLAAKGKGGRVRTCLEPTGCFPGGPFSPRAQWSRARQLHRHRTCSAAKGARAAGANEHENIHTHSKATNGFS